MNELKNLKKKYPSKKNEYGIINNDNNKIVIKNDTSNNIIIVQNKYDNINEILENNINIYSQKLENINKELKTTQETRKEKEIFLKEFSNNNYKQNLDKFVLLRNRYLEKENELMREKTLLKELNKNINNYLIDLEKTEELFREDKFFL